METAIRPGEAFGTICDLILNTIWVGVGTKFYEAKSEQTMKPAINLLIITTMLASLGIAIPVKADSVAARCTIYPKGQKQPSTPAPCVFSQHQGYVSIQLQHGKRYDLIPVGDRPENYIDQQGQAAYRQAGLGDRPISSHGLDSQRFYYFC